MRLLLLFFLELLRIFALLMLISGLAYWLSSRLPGNEAGLHFLILVLFAIWYRRYGQYSGWYPVKRN